MPGHVRKMRYPDSVSSPPLRRFFTFHARFLDAAWLSVSLFLLSLFLLLLYIFLNFYLALSRLPVSPFLSRTRESLSHSPRTLDSRCASTGMQSGVWFLLSHPYLRFAAPFGTSTLCNEGTRDTRRVLSARRAGVSEVARKTFLARRVMVCLKSDYRECNPLITDWNTRAKMTSAAGQNRLHRIILWNRSRKKNRSSKCINKRLGRSLDFQTHNKIRLWIFSLLLKVSK